MREMLQRAWLRRGVLARVLWPLSIVFGMLAALRRAAYRSGLLKSTRLPVPVIVVGNVVVGGAGKTPVVRAIVARFRRQGIEVGIISRGYGGRSTACREVRRDSTAADVGDEPLMLARTCRVPVFVGRDRCEAARALLAAHPGTRLIVSDDGLQHLALARDIEICVFDDRGVGNAWLLPAGPLREPWPRDVDLALRTSGTPRGIKGFSIRRRLAPDAIRRDGTKQPLKDLKGKRLVAVAGIAAPDAFFAMLRSNGLTLEKTIPLPDHHAFLVSPVEGGEIVCTEKDAVKLWRVRPDAWAVPLVTQIDTAFWQAFDSLVDAKLSSR